MDKFLDQIVNCFIQGSVLDDITTTMEFENVSMTRNSIKSFFHNNKWIIVKVVVSALPDKAERWYMSFVYCIIVPQTKQ